MTTPEKDPLDVFFEASKAAQPEASDALMARIMADAVALQPEPVVVSSPTPVGLWGRISDAMGGWPSMAGLATAAAAGLWIGIDTPTLADGVMSLYFETETEAAFLNVDTVWTTVLEDI